MPVRPVVTAGETATRPCSIMQNVIACGWMKIAGSSPAGATMNKIKMAIASIIMLTCSVVGISFNAQPASALMSNCSTWFNSIQTGGYAYCHSGSGGWLRVKLYCRGTGGYPIVYGPKVYNPGQVSGAFCPSYAPKAYGVQPIVGS